MWVLTIPQSNIQNDILHMSLRKHCRNNAVLPFNKSVDFFPKRIYHVMLLIVKYKCNNTISK